MTTEGTTLTLEGLKKLESEILKELKDFQRATVNRVCKIFRGGHPRVLVADEVGLGKTHIAKGVIAKLATLHKDEHVSGVKKNDDLFKVLYICSNIAIAKQNLEKLKIHDNVTVDNVSDARMSMQHLKIWEQKNDPKNRNNYIQLIPITPSTSFNISSGSGEAKERALMFCILPEFDKRKKGKFRKFLANGVEEVAFDTSIEKMEERINKCGTKYIKFMHNEISRRMHKKLKQDIFDLLIQNPDARYSKAVSDVIGELRKLFAEISIDMLEADRVQSRSVAGSLRRLAR